MKNLQSLFHLLADLPENSPKHESMTRRLMDFLKQLFQALKALLFPLQQNLLFLVHRLLQLFIFRKLSPLCALQHFFLLQLWGDRPGQLFLLSFVFRLRRRYLVFLLFDLLVQ